MQSISRWSVLNDTVRDVHPANLTLRDLGSDDPVFEELKLRYFSKDFLRLNKEDNTKMMNAFRSYIQFQKNSYLVSQILLNLSPDGWKEAIEVYLHFRHQISNQVAD